MKAAGADVMERRAACVSRLRVQRTYAALVVAKGLVPFADFCSSLVSVLVLAMSGCLSVSLPACLPAVCFARSLLASLIIHTPSYECYSYSSSYTTRRMSVSSTTTPLPVSSPPPHQYPLPIVSLSSPSLPPLSRAPTNRLLLSLRGAPLEFSHYATTHNPLTPSPLQADGSVCVYLVSTHVYAYTTEHTCVRDTSSHRISLASPSHHRVHALISQIPPNHVTVYLSWLQDQPWHPRLPSRVSAGL